MATTEGPGAGAGSLAPSLIVLLGALGTIGPLSIDMYLPALPTIGHELGGDPGAAQHSLAAYFAGLAIGGLAIGPVSDRFGRRLPLLLGLAAYILGSVGCALAHDPLALSGWRFLQALGGAAAMVIPRAVVRDHHTGAAAVRTMSMLMLVGAAAPIIAPMLGGVVLAQLGWRSIFAVLAGVGVLLLAGVALLVRDGPAMRSPGTGLHHVRELAREPRYAAYTIGGALGGAAMFAYIAGSPFVFITLHHVDPSHFGFFFGANALALVSAAQLARLLMRWIPPAVLAVRAAWGAAACGGLLLACAIAQVGGVWGVSIPLILLLGCLGLIGPTAGVLALEEHGQRAGLAAAVGGSLGMVLAAASSWLVGALHDGSALPMAATVAVCAAAGALVIARAPRPAAADGQPG